MEPERGGVRSQRPSMQLGAAIISAWALRGAGAGGNHSEGERERERERGRAGGGVVRGEEDARRGAARCCPPPVQGCAPPALPFDFNAGYGKSGWWNGPAGIGILTVMFEQSTCDLKAS